MRIHPVRIAVVLLLAGLLTGAAAQAQAPGTMVYQGRLLTAAGLPVTAATSVTFRIYSVASGGTALWTETRSVTPDANGVFTIELGTTTALTTSTFDGSVRYLGIQVSGESEMTPRQVLSSTPYALRAAAAAAPASVEGVVNNGGNIDIVPGAGLTVTGNDGANTITLGTTTGGMHPIAYGVINTNGTINNPGSGNWTVSWSATYNSYEVVISGLNFNLFNHLAIAQGMGISAGRTFLVDAVNNHLLISPRLHDNTVSQFLCSFMVYNLPGMTKIGEQAEYPPDVLQSTFAR